MAPRTRSDSPTDASDPALPLKRQARRRLLGAFVLATGVAIGFALFFDAEPRPALDDIQVRIPSRDSPLPDRADTRERAPTVTAAPSTTIGASEGPAVTVPAPVEAAPAAASDVVEARRDPAAAEPPSAGPSPAAGEPPSSTTAAAASAGVAAGAAAVAVSKAPVGPKAPAAVEAPATAARPSATEVRTDAKAVAGDPARGQGYFLQVGAFASEKAARDQVERIRRLGATAFTERIRTQQGERIRVRLGPFPTRDASDGLRQRLRSAGIDVTVVSP